MKRITKEDYPLLKTWFDKYENWPMPQESSLSAIGVMNHFAAGWLYGTVGTDLCIIEFVITDKDYRGDDRDEGVQEVVQTLGDIAKEEGYRVAFAWLNKPTLIEKYKNTGFLYSGECTELVKPL